MPSPLLCTIMRFGFGGIIVSCWALAGALTWSATAHAESSDIPSSCRSDRDCAQYPDSPWCTDEGWCYRCFESSDCLDVDEICSEGACITPCAEDLDCNAGQPTCDPALGQCVECSTDADCLAAEHCASFFCIDDVCTMGERRCAGNATLLECRPDGSGFATIETCAEMCEVDEDGTAACTTATGGSSDSGTGAATTASGADDEGDAATSGAPTGGDEGAGEDETGGAAGGSDEPPPGGLICSVGGGGLGSLWLAFPWLLSALRRTQRRVV